MKSGQRNSAHEHYLDMSLGYYAMKMKLLKEVNPNRD